MSHSCSAFCLSCRTKRRVVRSQTFHTHWGKAVTLVTLSCLSVKPKEEFGSEGLPHKLLALFLRTVLELSSRDQD